MIEERERRRLNAVSNSSGFVDLDSAAAMSVHVEIDHQICNSSKLQNETTKWLDVLDDLSRCERTLKYPYGWTNWRLHGAVVAKLSPLASTEFIAAVQVVTRRKVVKTEETDGRIA